MTERKDKELSAVEAARRLGVGLDYLYSLLWTGKGVSMSTQKMFGSSTAS
jgi:hypothetical protein